MCTHFAYLARAKRPFRKSKMTFSTVGGDQVKRETKTINKTINKHFRCSREEAKRLKLAAEKFEMKESEFIRAMISQVPSNHPEIRRQLDRLTNEMNKIGVNINQIAYACNVNPMFYDKDREKLMFYMRDCRKLLLEVIKYCNNENDAHVAGKGKESSK